MVDGVPDGRLGETSDNYFNFVIRRTTQAVPFFWVLIVALIIFGGLTVSTKDLWDRWIYGVITVAIVAAMVYHHQIPALASLR